jgi:hypothetical protein
LPLFKAIPTLLVKRYRDEFRAKFADLRILEVRWFSFIAYPCSGGFKPWSLISEPIARKLLWFERRLKRLFGHLFGFRLLIVI